MSASACQHAPASIYLLLLLCVGVCMRVVSSFCFWSFLGKKVDLVVNSLERTTAKCVWVQMFVHLFLWHSELSVILDR